MTYLLSENRKSATVGLNIYHSASAASLADDAVISWSTTKSGHASSYNFTITFSGSSFTVPSDSKTHMFEASLTWNGVHASGATAEISYQWYDTTNSQWVGSVATVTSGNAQAEGRTSTPVGDEVARFVTSTAINLELRLKSSSNSYGGLSYIDATSTGNPTKWYSAARCLVYKFG